MKFLPQALVFVASCALAAGQSPSTISEPIACTQIYFQFVPSSVTGDIDAALTEVGNELLSEYAMSQTESLVVQKDRVMEFPDNEAASAMISRELDSALDYVFDPQSDLTFETMPCDGEGDLEQVRMNACIRMQYKADGSKIVPYWFSGYFENAKTVLTKSFQGTVSSVHTSNRVGNDLKFLTYNMEGKEAWNSGSCDLVGEVNLPDGEVPPAAAEANEEAPEEETPEEEPEEEATEEKPEEEATEGEPEVEVPEEEVEEGVPEEEPQETAEESPVEPGDAADENGGADETTTETENETEETPDEAGEDAADEGNDEAPEETAEEEDEEPVDEPANETAEEATEEEPADEADEEEPTESVAAEPQNTGTRHLRSRS